MAKQPAKKKIDPLEIGLELLATADKETARAARFLYEALGEPFEKPPFENCEFKVGKKRYKAKLTSSQCEKIHDAVKKNENVNDLVQGLLGALNSQVGDSANAIVKLLEDGGPKAARSTPIKLGCCHYSGGKSANLSQAQCSHYDPATWDSTDPGCKNEANP
jgi:hypothetical protein